MDKVLKRTLTAALYSGDLKTFDQLDKIPSEMEGVVRQYIWNCLVEEEPDKILEAGEVLKRAPLTLALIETAMHRGAVVILEAVKDVFPWTAFTAFYAEHLAKSDYKEFVDRFDQYINRSLVDEYADNDNAVALQDCLIRALQSGVDVDKGDLPFPTRPIFAVGQ